MNTELINHDSLIAMRDMAHEMAGRLEKAFDLMEAVRVEGRRDVHGGYDTNTFEYLHFRFAEHEPVLVLCGYYYDYGENDDIYLSHRISIRDFTTSWDAWKAAREQEMERAKAKNAAQMAAYRNNLKASRRREYEKLHAEFGQDG